MTLTDSTPGLDQDEVHEHALRAPSSAFYATILTDTLCVSPISPRPHYVPKIYFSMGLGCTSDMSTAYTEPYECLPIPVVFRWVISATFISLLGDIIHCADRIGKPSGGF